MAYQPLGNLTQASVKNLPDLPHEPSPIPNNCYAVKHEGGESVAAVDDAIQTKIWFQTTTLSHRTIRRIRGIKLCAQSHDQGLVGQEDQGNWSWLELVILEDESATRPKKRPNGEELFFTSHENTLGSKEYAWLQGMTFDRHHDLLKWLKPGNVLAVRICARFAGWRTFAQDAHLVFDIGSDNNPVPFSPDLKDNDDGETPRRRNVSTWYAAAATTTTKQEPDGKTEPSDEALQLSLFIKAMIKFQALPPDDQMSYFRIAGIHGFPANVSWNMGRDPVPREAADLADPLGERDGGFYCPHNNFVFPTWHRAYMMLFEGTVRNLMIEEAKALGRGDESKVEKELGEEAVEKWRRAAETWRLPYWDWASEPRLPELVRNEDITIIDSWVRGSQPTMTTVPNPMYRFRMPGGAAMGDPKYGDYRVDGNEDGPWDLCKGTSRHAISYYDESRSWIEGRSDDEKVREALAGRIHPYQPKDPRSPDAEEEQLTLKDGVFRLLTHAYSTRYEHFASTRHEPVEEDAVNARGYLSLESIHNSVHNFVGGNNLVTGHGHMSSVPVAAFDPIFWLHHCNIDRLFYLWQCANPSKWFSKLKNHSTEPDRSRSLLEPFHRYEDEGFNSNHVRYVEAQGYTFDDVDEIVDEDGNVSAARRNEHVSRLYGPSSAAYKSDDEDVDPIINVVYNRYAFGGLAYTVHFFLWPLEETDIPHQKPKLVGSVHTFSSPFASPRATTGCPNCRDQAQQKVLSNAQIPLTRAVPIEERGDDRRARKYLQERLRWVVVLNNGTKMPRSTMPDLRIKLLLGRNRLGDRTEEPQFSNYEPEKEWDWEEAEL